MAKKLSKGGLRGGKKKVPAGEWKKSPTIAGILVVFILIVWGIILKGIFFPSSGEVVEFPYCYLPEGSNNPADVIVIRSSQPESVVVRDGKTYLLAYVCDNPKCPGRKGDTPFLFTLPKLPPNQPPKEEVIKCPACVKGKRQDVDMVGPYLNEEARNIIEELRKKYDKK